MRTCDPVTGACGIGETASGLKQYEYVQKGSVNDVVIRYVGDPMCSWCWGISPTVKNIEQYCAKENLNFLLTVGGLRAGGGDEWNSDFRSFLKNEWQHVASVTGQPFGFKILEKPYFNYDTEFSCRAVVAVKSILNGQVGSTQRALDFYARIQEKFYVEGDDPKEPSFYSSICEGLGIDYKVFANKFKSDEIRISTEEDFARARSLGVRSFPTLLIELQGGVYALGSGFVTTDVILEKIEYFMSTKALNA